MKTGALLFLAAALLAAGAERQAPPPPEPPAAEPGPPSELPAGGSGALTFAQLDLDKDGGVTWDEFLKGHAAAAGKEAGDVGKAAVMPAKEHKRLQRIFREADKDRSSILTQKEWDAYSRK